MRRDPKPRVNALPIAGILAISVLLGVGLASSFTFPGADASLLPNSLGSGSADLPSASAEPTPIALGGDAERAGVPDALKDHLWLTDVAAPLFWPDSDGDVVWMVGRLGTTASVVLPPGEFGLDAEGNRIASALVRASGSTLLVRNARTGAIERSAETGVIVRGGALLGDVLFWNGYAGDESVPADGGIWSLDLGEPDSGPELAVEPFQGVDRFAESGFDYGKWLTSPSGTLAIAWLGGGLNATHGVVFDADRRVVRLTFDDVTPRGVVEQGMVVTTAESLAFRQLDTGLSAWSVKRLEWDGGRFYWPVAGLPEFIISFDRDPSTYVIARLSLADGSTTDILLQSHIDTPQELTLAPSLSSEASLVLIAGEDLVLALAETGRTWASLLDPQTGVLVRDAFSIGVP